MKHYIKNFLLLFLIFTNSTFAQNYQTSAENLEARA